MEPPGDAVTEDDLQALLDFLGISGDDRAGCAQVLAAPALSKDAADIRRALTARLGSLSAARLEIAPRDHLAWIAAYLQLAPVLIRWHRSRGVRDDVIRATYSDLGRNLAIHRRAHGEFGLETWDWLIPHYTGMMFALGRLNFMLHPVASAIDGVVRQGDWAPSIHIPESGPLSSIAVDQSLRQAASFFGHQFPEKAIAVATCESWLLDPYLTAHLPVDSNISAFARRFTPTAEPYDDLTAALFFVFRTRDQDLIPTLPRHTTLQRIVLDRAERGEAWKVGSGYLRL